MSIRILLQIYNKFRIEPSFYPDFSAILQKKMNLVITRDELFLIRQKKKEKKVKRNIWWFLQQLLSLWSKTARTGCASAIRTSPMMLKR